MGALIAGRAPPLQAFKFACVSSSKGRKCIALTEKIFSLYPLSSSIPHPGAAARLLLHATASGDVETVKTALRYCGGGGSSCESLFDLSRIERRAVSNS